MKYLSQGVSNEREVIVTNNLLLPKENTRIAQSEDNVSPIATVEGGGGIKMEHL